MFYVVSDNQFLKHLTGPFHPEQPARVFIIDQTLERAGLKSPTNTLIPRLATKEDILLCHAESYFELVKREISSLQENEIVFLSTGDVLISKDSFEVALLAAGGALTAVDKVMTKENTAVFCNSRPPGHHACTSIGMGFCLFNNIAIAARYAIKKYGLKRVLIADFDVHHGNGTEEIFYNDPQVFYFSTHEKNLYPLTGSEEETGVGNILNVPIEATSKAREKMVLAYTETLFNSMEIFKPELVFISAGFDAHENDPLAHLNLRDEDYATITKTLKDIAKKHAKGRIVSILEGGYNLKTLSSAALEHCSILASS